jgi:hypothetical protein
MVHLVPGRSKDNWRFTETSKLASGIRNTIVVARSIQLELEVKLEP